MQSKAKCALIDHDKKIAFILPSRTHSQAFVKAYRLRYPLVDGASMHSVHFHKLITPHGYKIITFTRDPEERCISILCKLLEPNLKGRRNGLADIYGLDNSNLHNLAHQLINISSRIRSIPFFYPQQKYLDRADEIYEFNDIKQLNMDFDISLLPYHVSDQLLKKQVFDYFKMHRYQLDQLLQLLWAEDL